MAGLHARAFTVPRPWSEHEFAELLGSVHVFAITEANGLAVGRSVAGEAELLTIAVEPLRRRQGTGRRLLAAVEDKARLRKAERIILEVAADNAPAIALYSASGFLPVARRAAYYRDPADGRHIDALILAKSLAAAPT